MSRLPMIDVTFKIPTNGYWDGGARSGGVFEPKEESWCGRSFYGSWCGRKFYGRNSVKWGSWALNFFFTCKRGKTWKDSARIAARHIRRILRVPATVHIV